MTTLSNKDICKLFDVKTVYVKELSLPEHNDPDFVPTKDPNYVFDKNTLNQILMFLAEPFNDCLFLSGSSGCGKTSIILQIASRLNYPVQSITVSNKTEICDLIGHPILKDGSVCFEYGALANAMLKGEILLINEIDMIGAGELSALNDVIEGKPLVIVQNKGEIIKPHPNFRIIATGNTKGNGDETGFYNGARILNKAFLDRWRFVECNYPEKATEIKILAKANPELPDEEIEKLATLAFEIRKVAETSTAVGISTPFSTRTLLRIAHIFNSYENMEIGDAVEMGFSSRLSKIEHDYIDRLVKDIFGNEYQRLPKKVVEKAKTPEKVELTSTDSVKEVQKEDSKGECEQTYLDFVQYFKGDVKDVKKAKEKKLKTA